MIFIESFHYPAIILIITGTVISILAHKLTVSGAFAGAVIAFIIYISGGYTCLAMLSAFFLFGTAATFWKKEEKKPTINDPFDHSRRNLTQVLANAGIPGILGLLVFLDPAHKNAYLVMIGGSLASATADTLSSELGMIYGRRFYNILSFKPETKGLDGVISFEGTLIGIGGAISIACIFSISSGWNDKFWVILFAGIAGNLIDSLLGASLERRRLINNDLVNFLNTAAAALIAGLAFL